jgi:membrane associated rhomboid family serine protease
MADAWGWKLAFVAARYTNPDLFDAYAVTSPFTHLFVHGGWMHIAMNGLMFMAFGTAAERMLGGKRAAILFFACGLAGALTQFAINPFSQVPMVGASGALSGLFAAVILRMQQRGAMQGGRFGIWGLAAIWIGLSFAGAAIGGSFGYDNIAWAAHIGGFFAGIGVMKLKYFS